MRLSMRDVPTTAALIQRASDTRREPGHDPVAEWYCVSRAEVRRKAGSIPARVTNRILFSVIRMRRKTDDSRERPALHGRR